MSNLDINTPDFAFHTSESRVAIKRVKDSMTHVLNKPEVATVLGALVVNATPSVRTKLLPLIFDALAPIV